jgi:hypothetical protein
LMTYFNDFIGYQITSEAEDDLTSEADEHVITEQISSAHNPLWEAIGGRLYNTYAPDGTTLPYAVFQHISSRPDDTFTEKLDDVLIQFTIFSTNPSSSEVHTAMQNLKTLFDDCTFPVTGATIVKFRREGEGLTSEEFETVDGLQRGWSYYVEYSVLVRKTA